MSIDAIDPADDRSEDEIIAQAAAILVHHGDHWPTSTLRLLFSMALTWCHYARATYYAEHDANRLLRRMIGDARDMRVIPSLNLSGGGGPQQRPRRQRESEAPEA